MYMRQNIVSHFMSLCRFGRKMGLQLCAKSGRSDIFYQKRLHQVTLDHDRNATAMSFWISAAGAIVKMSLWPPFAPSERHILRPKRHNDIKCDTIFCLIYIEQLHYRHLKGSSGHPRFITPIYIVFYGSVLEKNKFIFANV